MTTNKRTEAARRRLSDSVSSLRPSDLKLLSPSELDYVIGTAVATASDQAVRASKYLALALAARGEKVRRSKRARR